MAPSRERAVFFGAVGALWLLFFVQAWLTPVLLDDWYQLTWHRHHEFGLSSIWEYAHYNYFHFNPRLGDVLLLIVNGPPVFHLVLTPLVEVSLLWLGFALAFGRWPRPTLRDLQLLLILQVMIWLITPIPGLLYFYRPFCTNYLWAFTTTIALFVPYRIALARDTSPPRWWLAPIVFVVGWAAGMSNEHTGPTAMVAIACLVVWAWKTKRLRGWMFAGMAGLYIGYPMLFFAPGQSLRYAGMATRNKPLQLLAERGITGCFEIVLDMLGEAQLAIGLLAFAVLVYVLAIRRRGAAVPTLSREITFVGTALVMAAGSIIVTLFASPTVGERLFFASSVLLAIALTLFSQPLLEERRARRVLVGACVVIFAYHAVKFVSIYSQVKEENDDRIALLSAGPRDRVVNVPPYTHYERSRWHWGDDFQYASLREYVGNEVFDLDGIEMDRYLRWVQPSPPDHYVATRTFDPPLSPEQAAAIAPVHYIPTYWEWTMVQLRRLLVLGPLGKVEGHRLVRYVVDSEGLGLVDPLRRPVRVLEWTPQRWTFVDGRPWDDDSGRAFIQIWKGSIPAGVREAYVVACGETRPAVLLPDPNGIGPVIPVALDCRGTTTAVLCEPDTCWFSGRYWR
ncbi:MAG: DUF6056 family protein [Kofleriaceae bacterium]